MTRAVPLTEGPSKGGQNPPLPPGSPRPPAPMGRNGGDVRCACGHKRKHHEESDGGTEPRWIACKGFKPEGE